MYVQMKVPGSKMVPRHGILGASHRNIKKIFKNASFILVRVPECKEAPLSQGVKRWPTDLADQIRSSLDVKSSQP